MEDRISRCAGRTPEESLRIFGEMLRGTPEGQRNCLRFKLVRRPGFVPCVGQGVCIWTTLSLSATACGPACMRAPGHGGEGVIRSTGATQENPANQTLQVLHTVQHSSCGQVTSTALWHWGFSEAMHGRS